MLMERHLHIRLTQQEASRDCRFTAARAARRCRIGTGDDGDHFLIFDPEVGEEDPMSPRTARALGGLGLLATLAVAIPTAEARAIGLMANPDTTASRAPRTTLRRTFLSATAGTWRPLWFSPRLSSGKSTRWWSGNFGILPPGILTRVGDVGHATEFGLTGASTPRRTGAMGMPHRRLELHSSTIDP